MALTDWSVFARYFDQNAPKTTFANNLVDLAPYLFNADGRTGARKLRAWASNALLPFPELHSLASRGGRRIRNAGTMAKRWIRYMRYKRGNIGDEAELALVLEDVHGFNIVRFFHKFYAIPRGEGPFVVSKADGKLYSKSHCAYSLDKVVSRVNRSRAGCTSRNENAPRE